MKKKKRQEVETRKYRIFPIICAYFSSVLPYFSSKTLADLRLKSMASRHHGFASNDVFIVVHHHKTFEIQLVHVLESTYRAWRHAGCSSDANAHDSHGRSRVVVLTTSRIGKQRLRREHHCCAMLIVTAVSEARDAKF